MHVWYAFKVCYVQQFMQYEKCFGITTNQLHTVQYEITVSLLWDWGERTAIPISGFIEAGQIFRKPAIFGYGGTNNCCYNQPLQSWWENDIFTRNKSLATCDWERLSGRAMQIRPHSMEWKSSGKFSQASASTELCFVESSLSHSSIQKTILRQW